MEASAPSIGGPASANNCKPQPMQDVGDPVPNTSANSKPVEHKQVVASSTDPQVEQVTTGTFSRDEFAKKEEESGMVSFRIAWNDASPQMMVDLINLKNIFSAQLPKMPREYIVRLVLDRNHRTMCILRENRVIGGICFRPFPSQRFAEIVFCAITSTQQVKGYGTRIMNHLKEHVKTEGIDYFLTYAFGFHVGKPSTMFVASFRCADNYAIGYFKKQGFTQHITMPKDRWFGYIKDYDGSTLMECKINQNVKVCS